MKATDDRKMTVVPVGDYREKKVWSVITCATFAHRCPNSSSGEDLTNDAVLDLKGTEGK